MRKRAETTSDTTTQLSTREGVHLRSPVSSTARTEKGATRRSRRRVLGARRSGPPREALEVLAESFACGKRRAQALSSAPGFVKRLPRPPSAQVARQEAASMGRSQHGHTDRRRGRNARLADRLHRLASRAGRQARAASGRHPEADPTVRLGGRCTHPPDGDRARSRGPSWTDRVRGAEPERRASSRPPREDSAGLEGVVQASRPDVHGQVAPKAEAQAEAEGRASTVAGGADPDHSEDRAARRTTRHVEAAGEVRDRPQARGLHGRSGAHDPEEIRRGHHEGRARSAPRRQPDAGGEGHLTSPSRSRPSATRGIGATGGGSKAPPRYLGKAIRAHVGRLLAYALPEGKGTTPTQRALIKEALEVRELPPDRLGCAPILAGLSKKWAMDPQYARKIAAIANQIRPL